MVTYKERIEIVISELEDIAKTIPTDRYTYDMDRAIKVIITQQGDRKNMTLLESEEYVNMDDVYAEISNTKVLLSIDKDDLIIRIPYISGYPEDIIKTVRGK